MCPCPRSSMLSSPTPAAGCVARRTSSRLGLSSSSGGSVSVSATALAQLLDTCNPTLRVCISEGLYSKQQKELSGSLKPGCALPFCGHEAAEGLPGRQVMGKAEGDMSVGHTHLRCVAFRPRRPPAVRHQAAKTSCQFGAQRVGG